MKNEAYPLWDRGELQATDEHFPTPQVIDALSRWSKFQDALLVDVLRALRWDNLNGCWLFGWKGMTVGVEEDGYIHT